MLGVQQPRTAAHPTSIPPATKAKKLGLPQSKQTADSQKLDSVISWPEISRVEPDEEEEEEEKLDNPANDSKADRIHPNNLSNQKPNHIVSDKIGTVEQNTSSSQLLSNGQQNGHFGMGNPSDFGYSAGVDSVFGMGDSLEYVDPSLYLNLDADVVGPSEGEQLADTYLNLTDDHVGTSKDDPVPVSSGEQEQQAEPPAPVQEAGSSVSEAKPPSRALTPLSELTPSPRNEGDRSTGGEENGDPADTSSSSLRVDLSKLDEGDEKAGAEAGDANAQPASALTDLSAQPSPTAGSNVEQNNAVDGVSEDPASKPNLNGSSTHLAPSPDKQSVNSSQSSSSPASGQTQSHSQPQQNYRPQNPYPMVYPHQSAFASGSGSQIPNLPPLPKREGDANQKIVTVLELNSELFKACLAFQANGVSWNSTEATPYSRKLQSNLTWLATHYDVQQKEDKTQEPDPPLPELDAPTSGAGPAPSVALPQETTQRIHALYQQMSKLFARDVAKRERKIILARAGLPASSTGVQNPRLSMQMNAAKPTPSPTPSLPSGGLTSVGIKRERSEAPHSGAGAEGNDSSSSPSAKRRDTGEGKTSTMPTMPGARQSQTPAPSGPQGAGDASQAGSTPGMNTNPAAITGMGINAMSMGRPSSRAGFMSNQNMAMPPADGSAAAAMLAQNNAAMAGMQMQGMPNLQNMNPQQAAMFRQQMQIRQAQMMQRHQMHMQQQAAAQQNQGMAQGQSRQMSPSAATQNQGPQPQMGTNMGAGMNAAGMAMGQNPNQPPGQMMQVPGAAGGINPALAAQMAAIPQAVLQQVLSNPQHPMMMYLKQTVPNFTMLPAEQQMQRLQLMVVQKQRQQASQHQQQVAGMPGTPMRNMAMPNGMSPTQFRQPNVPGASNVNQAQLQHQLAQAQQSGAQASGGNMYPNVAGLQQGMMNQNPNMAAGGAMAMSGQLQSMNPQQRQQLLLLQQQQHLAQRGMAAQGGMGGMPGGMNPAMMNAQAIQQQRLAAMQRQGMSPLNPNSAGAAPAAGGMAGSDMNQQQQFAAALRSNPAVPGIARSTRSPSVSELGTPRLGGRMLSGQGQNDEYHRALLQQQQRSVQAQMQQNMMQASSPGQAQQSGAWQNPQQMGQFGAGSPNPGAQGWPQQPGFPHAGSPSAPSFPPSRQASSTPAPMTQQSPSQSNSELDIYAWTQGQP